MAFNQKRLKKLNRKLAIDARRLDDVFESTPRRPSRRAAEALGRLEAHLRQAERLVAGLDSGGSNKAELKRLRLLIEVVDQLGVAAAATKPEKASKAISAANRARRKHAAARKAVR
jgi:hypothetical protein